MKGVLKEVLLPLYTGWGSQPLWVVFDNDVHEEQLLLG